MAKNKYNETQIGLDCALLMFLAIQLQLLMPLHLIFLYSPGRQVLEQNMQRQQVTRMHTLHLFLQLETQWPLEDKMVHLYTPIHLQLQEDLVQSLVIPLLCRHRHRTIIALLLVMMHKH